jgi:DNA topoisomerase-1
LLTSAQLRLYPEDITLNIGQNATVPEPNVPGKWGKVIHDNTVTWLAHWKENINGNAKYVFLAAGSSLKGQSDMQKFEKARELKVSQSLPEPLLTIDRLHLRNTLTTSVTTTMPS